MRDLKENTVNKAKRNLERACKGGGYFNILTSSQDVTDLSRGEFRNNLRWSLDLPLQNPPCYEMPTETRLQWITRAVTGGGVF